jgi:hypothetical protein
MRIAIVTPADRTLRTGNRITALRWAQRLRELGHGVRVSTQWSGENADALVAIHAARSAESALRWSERAPRAPLIVVLSGTDVYGELGENALQSLDAAHRIVALQPLACTRLDARQRAKCTPIVQSAPD